MKASTHIQTHKTHVTAVERSSQPTSSAKAVLPNAQRTKTTWETVCSKLSRLANAIAAPGGLRADPRARQHTKETLKAMRDLVQGLSANPPPSDAAIAQHLDSLSKATQLLHQADRTRVPSTQIQLSLNMQLLDLPLPALKQFRTNADAALARARKSDSPLKDQLGQLQDIADQVHERCVARLSGDLGNQTTPSEPAVAEVLQRIAAICNKAMEASRNDPTSAEQELQTLQGRTLGLVEKYGLKRPGVDPQALGMQVLKDIFALNLLRETANDAGLLQVFLAMPPTMRAELRAAPATGFPDTVPQIDSLLDQATAIKHERLEASLVHACAAFEASAELPNHLEQQSAQLGIVIAHGKAMDAHSEAHKASTGHGIGDEARSAFGRAREAAARLDLSKLDPTQVSDQALHQLDNSFEALEIKVHATRIQAEKARRKEQCSAPFQLATADVLNSLAKGDLKTAVKHLESMQQCFERALAVHLALGERANDLDGRSALFARLLKEFFSSQPASTVRKWASALQSDQVLLLAEALEAFCRDALTPDHQDVSQIGTRLKLLHVILNPPRDIVLAEHRGGKSGTLNDLQVRHATRVMNETTRELVRYLIGSDPTPMDEATQDAMKGVLNAITTSVRDDAPNAAWNEMTRDIMNVAMSDTDDNLRLAMDGILQASIQTSLSSQRTLFLAEGISIKTAAQLHEEFPIITTAQLRSLAKLANTNVWKSAKVESTLASDEHTPVRLPDGSPLLLDTPECDDIYRITQGSNGQLNVIVERVQSKALDAVNMTTGKRAEVDKNASTVTLSVGFTLHPDGSLSMAEPVSCHAHIQPKASTAS